MMDIREVRVVVVDHSMLMRVAVGLAGRHILGMCVLVVFIVGMAMGVLQRLMFMLMLMAFGQV